MKIKMKLHPLYHKCNKGSGCVREWNINELRRIKREHIRYRRFVDYAITLADRGLKQPEA